MGELGDLLEAVYRAPGATAFRGHGRQGSDHARVREAFERRNRRRRGRVVSGFAVSRDAPTGYREDPVRFWRDGPRWRFDDGATRTITTPEGRFSFFPGHGGTVTPSTAHQPWASEHHAIFFAPRRLVAGFVLADVERSTTAGRTSWHVSARPDDEAGPPMGLFAVGDVIELWFDVETGIVLRADGLLDGELVTRFEIDELTTHGAVDATVFAFETPDGSPVRSHGERLLEQAREAGVDVTGIDPDDLDQVRTAMSRSAGHSRPADDLEARAAQHIATGPPPDDLDGARRAVEHACTHMGERTADDNGLVNIQAGGNLGPATDEIARRFPEQMGAAPVVVRQVKFLNATEAVVWMDTGPIREREGRAVLDDGTWKVSRATYCDLLRQGGVTCPPPP